MENENDPFNSIILDENEESGKPKQRFIKCARCGKKIRNTPDKINGHERYCKRKKTDKKQVNTRQPDQAKPVIEKEKMIINPVSETPAKKINKNTSMPEKKGLKINFADILLIGGLVCIGLLFMSLLKGSRPASENTVP